MKPVSERHLADEEPHRPPNAEASEQSALLQPQVPLKDDENDDDVPYKNIDGKKFRRLFICILMATFISFFDSTFMASSHPVITSYFQASHVASWLSTTFYLCSTVTQPFFGRLSDTFGRKPIYLLAMSLFGLATAWCAAAQSITSLIVARAVCGFGSGGLLALGDVLMANTIKLEYRGLYQSYLNMAFGSGNALGAALGGLMCEHLGWRAAFALQLPFVAAFIVLACSAVPSDLGPCLAKKQGLSVFQALRTLDGTGALVLTFTVSGLILGINLGGNVFAWSHPLVVASLAVFAVGLPLLVVVERRATLPMLPPVLLSSVPTGNLMWSNFFGMMISNAALFNVPLFLQAVRQASPTLSGLFLVSPLVGILVCSVLTGFFIKRTGKLKLPAVVGTLSMLLGTITCSLLSIRNLPSWAIVFLIPWISIGQGFLFPTTVISVLALCDPNNQAVVVTTLGLSRYLGSMVGIAVSSWGVQNFLNLYLSRLITGDSKTKKEIITRVRKSVQAISGLDEPYKSEAIAAYSLALRNTFLAGSVFAAIVIGLIVPLRLPRVGRRQHDKPKGADAEGVARDGETR